MLSRILIAGLMASLLGLAQAAEEEAPTVIDLSNLLTLDSLVKQIEDRRVVFVGESHDRYEHHLNQLAVIKHQHELHPDLAIGLEFFQQLFQPALDDYIAGRIDEAEFIRRSEYFERWSFDYRLYRPIFSYAREQGIPLIALNIEKEITDQVREGGMQSLSEEQLARIPKEIDRDDATYRQRLEGIFKHHPQTESSDFEHFLDVQLLWDEGMAERAAVWLREHPKGHMVILAGVGHLVYGAGIPNRLKRRVPASSAILINARIGSEVDPQMGDYLIMTKRQELPPSGKLGVFLNTEESPPGIVGFSDGSGAEAAGLKEGDVLLKIDDQKIANYTDIRLALMDRQVGDKVTVEVERKGLIFGSLRHRMQVELK